MDSEKLIIGLIGRIGSGKGTAAQILESLAGDNGVTVQRVAFSDLLRNTLIDFGIEPTRDNLQQLAIFFHNRRADALGHKMQSVLMSDSSPVSIVDGIRWQSDLDLIKSFPSHLIIYITTTPEARFERLVSRAEKPLEHKMSYEEFLGIESVATETQIDELGALADVEVANTGTVDELRQRLAQVWEERIAACLVHCIHG